MRLTYLAVAALGVGSLAYGADSTALLLQEQAILDKAKQAETAGDLHAAELEYFKAIEYTEREIVGQTAALEPRQQQCGFECRIHVRQ